MVRDQFCYDTAILRPFSGGFIALYPQSIAVVSLYLDQLFLPRKDYTHVFMKVSVQPVVSVHSRTQSRGNRESPLRPHHKALVKQISSPFIVITSISCQPPMDRQRISRDGSRELVTTVTNAVYDASTPVSRSVGTASNSINHAPTNEQQGNVVRDPSHRQ